MSLVARCPGPAALDLLPAGLKLCRRLAPWVRTPGLDPGSAPAGAGGGRQDHAGQAAGALGRQGRAGQPRARSQNSRPSLAVPSCSMFSSSCIGHLLVYNWLRRSRKALSRMAMVMHASPCPCLCRRWCWGGTAARQAVPACGGLRTMPWRRLTLACSSCSCSRRRARRPAPGPGQAGVRGRQGCRWRQPQHHPRPPALCRPWCRALATRQRQRRGGAPRPRTRSSAPTLLLRLGAWRRTMRR